ncbi:MAG TPA: aromatic ring-hydroxylating dioxygenase subunit alpha, partial [Rhodanobacteraceae bacterium]|nr:aromatic ring-hydroxylating dioxygenase subunit alpha [Rhodanobacteraceae bacterium]
MQDAARNDTEILDLDHAHALSPRYYAGATMLGMEQRAVFARSWQPVAWAEQLAAPGDHVVDEIAGV